MTFHSWRDRISRRLVAWRFDIAVVAFFVGISVFVVRPFVEYWGWAVDFRVNGIGRAYSNFMSTHILRPLHAVPPILDWVLGHGSTFGFVLGFSILLTLKYLAWRWAFAALDLDAARRRLLTIAATLLPLWPSGWYLRQSAGELAVIFFALAFGCALRMRAAFSWRYALAGALMGALGLAAYQALIVVTVAAPFACIAGASGVRARLQRGARAAAPLFGAAVLYGGYVFIIRVVVGSVNDYESAGADPTRWASVGALIKSVTGLFATTYGAQPAVLGVIAFVVLAVVGSEAFERSRRLIVVAVGALLLLPLASLPYVVTEAWTNDPGRVMLPVSVALTVLLAGLAAEFSPGQLRQPHLAGAGVAAAFALSIASALTAFSWVAIQRSILTQVASASAKGATVVMVEDESGEIGDVYTFLPGILQNAVDAKQLPIKAYVCQGPDGVPDRPYSERLTLAPPPRCGDPSLPPPDAVVVVSRVPGGGVTAALQPMPRR